MNITLTLNNLSESICKAIDEAFKSKKLSNFALEHGGIKNQRWSSDFANDLYNMSDEDFDEYVKVDPEQHYAKYGVNGYDRTGYTNNNFQPIEFKDGTFMVRKDPPRAFDDRAQQMIDKRFDRWKNRKGDGKDRYNFENPYIDKLVNGESPYDSQARGNWGYQGDEKLEKSQLNPRALRQRHNIDTELSKYRNNRNGEEDDMVGMVRKHSPRLKK